MSQLPENQPATSANQRPGPLFALSALVAGAIWGALAIALARQTLGDVIWGGVIASPLIGLATAIAFRGFRHRTPGMRIALALLSLYFAAGLFALAVGIMDASQPIPHRKGGAVVIQTVLGVWWGITFTGFLPLLWPLAYLTHSLLGRVRASVRSNESGTATASGR